jgi:hypothetical protein
MLVLVLRFSPTYIYICKYNIETSNNYLEETMHKPSILHFQRVYQSDYQHTDLTSCANVEYRFSRLCIFLMNPRFVIITLPLVQRYVYAFLAKQEKIHFGCFSRRERRTEGSQCIILGKIFLYLSCLDSFHSYYIN